VSDTISTRGGGDGLAEAVGDVARVVQGAACAEEDRCGDVQAVRFFVGENHRHDLAPEQRRIFVQRSVLDARPSQP